jgi:NAD(P)-dependent dehydrogenase (short-subunit alcohol dehydrogenase family)
MPHDSIPDLSGSTGIVTGASSGIGLYTALGLARTGMHVVMVGRDPARTEAARRFVVERCASASVELALADFASLDAVRGLTDQLLTRHAALRVLVNNAGLASPTRARSSDGIELTFAVNHLAPFLLTNLLLDRLKACAPSRIVTVASEAHRGMRLDLDDLEGWRDWTMLRTYGRTKLCNILFTRELDRRVRGTGVVATCLHPGVVATSIGERGGLLEVIWRCLKPFMTSPEKGASTSIFLATAPEAGLLGGEYVVKRRAVRADPIALDTGLARQLWIASARLAGIPAGGEF